MKKILNLFVACSLSLFICTSCEKVNMEEEDKKEIADGVNLTFHVAQFEQLSFNKHQARTRVAVPISDVCSRISLAIFQGDNKVKSINQTSSSEDFGKLNVTLAKGRYQIVIIAHSGEGSATVTSPTEIKFHNNKVTDTFYFYEDITVENDMRKDVVLQRAVAKFVLATDDIIPENVTQMEFKYTGGSSTFDAVSGRGCVNSRQTETRKVSTGMLGKPGTFEIYTFPRTDSKGLNLTITAQDQSGTALVEKSFMNVAVQVNAITQYSGVFFGGFVDAQAREFHLKADTTWARKDDVRF